MTTVGEINAHKEQWRSMYDAPCDGTLVKLLGYRWTNTTITEDVGCFLISHLYGDDKRAENMTTYRNWLTKDNVLFKPIGWLPLDAVPADEVCFQVGKTYLTNEGYKVKIIKESYHFGHPYACVQGNDGGWRYNRIGKTEMGRVTGTSGDLSFPGCLLLPSVEPDCSWLKQFFNWLFNKERNKHEFVSRPDA